MYPGKIFGIGFHKTGTSSLAAALRRLGYKTVHGDPRGAWPGADEGITLTRMIDAGDYRLPTLEIFDAFTDNPYFTVWRQLVRMFPDAKFILTVRNPDAWIESCARYYKGRRIRPMRRWMFGVHADPSASAAAKRAWLDAYRRHYKAVLEYFAAASTDRFLSMNISRGDGWEQLCPFLHMAAPSKPFPHANQTSTARHCRGATGLDQAASELPKAARRGG